MAHKINQSLEIDIDKNADDRQSGKEPAHCFVKKRGRRTAWVRLDPYVDVEDRTGALNANEIEMVVEYCERNRSQLVREYNSR